MTKKFNIAIVGATGAVGKTVLEILAERQFPLEKLYLLASERSVGEVIDFKNKSYYVEKLDDFNFANAHIAFFCAGGEVAKAFAPKAAEAGCIVIDKSSYFRMNPEIPLIIPEVNPEAVADYKAHKIIASPNCSTTPLAMVLKPLQEAVGIDRVNVSTYQSVSGAGKKGLEDLAKQTAAFLNGKSFDSIVFPAKIAFNLIPHIDDFTENGYTKEEMKMILETQKLLNDPHIKITATAVRVPVFYGHSESVSIETKKKITVDEVRALLAKMPGVSVLDAHGQGGYPTPIETASGKDEVFVGRIREDVSCEKGISLWLVCDNIRKGAALNAVQIAELLVKDYL